MKIIGIDLGTTNSLGACFLNGRPQIIANSLGNNLTPSVVGLDDNGEILVGAAARERLVSHPQLTASVFKRRMGTDTQVTLGKRHFRAEELSALVLRSIKADAEAHLGAPITDTVISVPAYFSDAQRKATKVAGELAGLRVERLINEPTAAAIAYGLHVRETQSKFLVFDLGGGTFDVSVLELFDGVMEVRATAGDNFLGGEDFADLLVKEFLRRAEWSEMALTSVERSRLRLQAETAKIKLSRDIQTGIAGSYGGKTFDWQITREDFETLAQPLLERLRQPVERAMRDCRLRTADLNAVILAGGATRMPMVRSLVARMFGQLPTAQLNPDEVVALGAAVQAGLLADDAALKETVLTDVCPYTLGIETAFDRGNGDLEPGGFAPIIDRNTVVPCSRVKRFWPSKPLQRVVSIEVFQGESRLVANNIKLGEFSISLPLKSVADNAVDIRFSYDMNGILEVEATVVPTGKKHILVIEKNPGVLSVSEIASRLKELETLKIHPRDGMPARTILARAERLYEESLGSIREAIADRILDLETVLGRQDPKEAASAIADLSAFLDEIEKPWNL